MMRVYVLLASYFGGAYSYMGIYKSNDDALQAARTDCDEKDWDMLRYVDIGSTDTVALWKNDKALYLIREDSVQSF